MVEQMPRRPERGALIVLEGLDRAGKTTQAELLVSKLKAEGREAQLWRYPDRTTTTGKLINEYLTSTADTLSDEAIHLLFAANRWEKNKELARVLMQGITVVCDRYSFSGAVYTRAKSLVSGKGRLEIDWCWAPEIGLVAPDLIVYLELDESVQIARGGFGAERYETLEMQRAVAAAFNEMWWRLGFPGRNAQLEGRKMHRVDASSTIPEVADEIWKHTVPILHYMDTHSEPYVGLWQLENR